MLAIIAAICAFIGASATIAWASGLVRNPAEARLGRLAPHQVRRAIDAPFSDRVFVPVLDSIVRAFVSVLPHRLVARIDRQLLASGAPMSALAFFTIVLLGGILFPAAAAFLLVNARGELDTVALLLVAWIAAAGVLAPFMWLSARARSRRLAIWRRLADAFDMVTVCVEAGLGLDAALRQVASKAKGPLAEEVALTLRQVAMGRPRREALEDLSYRVDIPEMTTFVNAVIQAEQLGTSLGRVLRSQSLGLRTQRRQKAQEVANKAPVKMVFPLVVFMMPTFFIVTLGPIAIHIINFTSE
jgi:tight adherence protein C